MRSLSRTDQVISSLHKALNTVFTAHSASRPAPKPVVDPGLTLTPQEKALSASLMRVNHVGEVCAQALYDSQALGTRNEALKVQFEHAAREEADHLAWTEQRIEALGGRKSVLNPLFYFGSFAMGALSGIAGDRWNMGFLAETERQVEGHLTSHLDTLPDADTRSRAVVEKMRTDEAAHARTAVDHGGAPLPAPVAGAMRAVAKVMTSATYRW